MPLLSVTVPFTKPAGACAAELLAKTALDLIEQPELLATIKEEHQASLAKGN